MSNDEAAPDSPGGTTESGEKTPDKLPADSLSGTTESGEETPDKLPADSLSGTVCSVDLSEYGDGGTSSQGSDSEAVASRVDRFGFLGGNQYTEPA